MLNTKLEPQTKSFITSFIRRNKVVADATPILGSGTRLPHGPFQFQTCLTPGAAYDLEVSSDMERWSPLDSGTTQTGTVEFLDSDASDFGFRFYRATSGDLISHNILGYAAVTLTPGFSMIANPFHAPSNTIAALFPDMPDGTTLCKFDTSLFRLTNNRVKNGVWTNPNEELVPGEGAIFYNPTSELKTVNFIGHVSQGRLLNAIPAGLSIRSSLVPQPGRLDRDLGFPIAEGDVVHIFDRDEQKYTLYPYSAEAWERNPPVIAVGESFWVGKINPGNWVRNFSVT